MSLWPNQQRALDATPAYIGRGVKHWCVVSPTASGKSRVMQEEIRRAYDQSMRIHIYSFRKLLTNQLIGYLEELRVPFGVKAAEFEKTYENPSAGIQLISPQTEASRRKRLKWDVDDADFVIVDEAHMCAKGETRELIQRHVDNGAVVIEYTATPTKDLRNVCRELFIAGVNSEMRRLGALLPAYVYDCGCMDLDKIKRHSTTNEFNNQDLQDAGYVQAILGSVNANFERQNPDRLPTLISWPGVKESVWGTDELAKRGHRFAHIDGESVYVDGQHHKSDQAAREDVIARVGEDLHGLCHRFVLREAINIPKLYCGILATPIGSMTSYVQVVGRMLRAYPGMDHIKILDHGGNARRHGSPNEDWDWEELSQMTSSQIESTRTMRKQKGKVDPGTACPGCGMMYRVLPEKCECGREMKREYKCPVCGHEHTRWPLFHQCEACKADMRRIRKRPVIQEDGTMEFVDDNELREKPTKSLGEKTQGMWSGIFWAARKNGRPAHLPSASPTSRISTSRNTTAGRRAT